MEEDVLGGEQSGELRYELRNEEEGGDVIVVGIYEHPRDVAQG